MVYAKGLHPGAVWKKTDLQIHTPRDAGWEGGPHLGGETPCEDAARKTWADKFVAKCRELQLQVIAITDHHDFCFIPYIRDAIQRAGTSSELWLFPGVEVTCNDSAQCLLLFDCESVPAVWLRLFGGHLQNVIETPATAPQCPQTDLCGKDLDDFIASVGRDSVVAGASIVLPHASDHGHKTVLRTGWHNRFKSLAVDGVYVEKPFSSIDNVAKQKIYGEITAWGNRRRGIVATGDNRQEDFRNLAVNPCWIRLGEPTTESLRQALLADEARICYESPSIPAQRIVELRVSSSLCGPSFRVKINDGYTAFIGGRGSGKTAILEYLRFGLGRSSTDTGTEGVIGERERNLIASTLSGGEVSVVLERDGVQETWRRKGDDPNRILVEVSNGPSEEITLEEAQERFKARAYAQKQLSTLVTSGANAAEQITGIAAAEFAGARRALDKEIGSIQREITVAVQRVVEFWVGEAQDKQVQATVADLKRRLESTQKRLQESGLDQETANTLTLAPQYRTASSYFSGAAESIQADAASLETVGSSIPSFDPADYPLQIEFPEVSRFRRALDATREEIGRVISDAVQKIRDLEPARESAAAEFETRLGKFEEQHTAAIQQQSQLKDLINESQRLEKELRESDGRARSSAQRLRTLSEAPATLGVARDRLDGALQRKKDILQSAAQAVTQKSQLLRAVVSTEDLPSQYVNSVLSICENLRVRELQSRCEERVQAIVGAGGQEWRRVGDKLIEVLKAKIQAGELAQAPTEEISGKLQSEIFFEMTTQQVGGVYKQLDANSLSRVLSATRDDFISFEYRDKGGLIPFAQASPGQQAAALFSYS